MINNNPILFFDSGIGGLTTLFECAKILPNEHYLYYADENNLPYGNKNIKTLRKLLFVTLSKLVIEFKPKIVVIACNTATAIVILKMRTAFPEVIFVGAEPAIIPAIKQKKSILLLCTKNTLKTSRIIKLCKKYYNFLSFCPENFASLVEQNFDDNKILEESINSVLSKFVNKVDCVVLGCTHYVFLKNQIRQLFGKRVTILDGNEGIAKRIEYCLKSFDIFGANGGIKFLNKGPTYTRLVCAYLKLLGGA